MTRTSGRQNLEKRSPLPLRLAALMALAAVVYLAGLTPHWRAGMDQAYYVSVAGALSTGKGYTFSGETQWSMPPGGPLYLAAAHRLGRLLEPGKSFPENAIYLNAFMLAAGLAGLAVGLMLIAEMARSAVGPDANSAAPANPPNPAQRVLWLSPAGKAMAAAVLLVFSVRYYRLSMETMSDVPYAVISWTAMLLLLRHLRVFDGAAQDARPRGTLAAAAVFLALAPLMRVTGIVLVAVVAGFLLARAVRSKDRRQFVDLTSVAPAMALCLAMVAAIWLSRNNPTFSYVTGEAGAVGEGREVGFLRAWALGWPSRLTEVPARLFGALFGFGSMAAPGAAVFVVTAVGAAVWWRRGQVLAVVCTAMVIAMAAMMTAPQTRYFVPVLPFLLVFAVEGTLVTGAFAATLVSRVAGKGRAASAARSTAGLAAAALFAAALAANAWQVSRVISLRFSDNFYSDYQKGEYLDYPALAQAFASSPPPGAVMAREYRVIHALSGAPVVPARASWARIKPSAAELDDYVRTRSVGTIVIDPRHAAQALVLKDYVEQNPGRWRQSAIYGKLEVYARAD